MSERPRFDPALFPPGAAPPVRDKLRDNPRFRNWLAVGRTLGLWHKRLVGVLTPLGLKLPQYDILANVYRDPGLSQQRLAEKLIVGRSNLSMLLPDLEERGLVLRADDADDKRIRRLFLTPAGAEITAAAIAAHAEMLDAVMAVLTPQECDQLGDLMRRISEELER